MCPLREITARHCIIVAKFLRSLDLPSMNCEVGFNLSRTNDCVLIEYYNNITEVIFMIPSSKHYIPVVTFSMNHNIKLLKTCKLRFKITISWNKCISKITTQPKKMYYMLDTFRNINSCFSELVKMILQLILFLSVTCHYLKSKILMHYLTISHLF